MGFELAVLFAYYVHNYVIYPFSSQSEKYGMTFDMMNHCPLLFLGLFFLWGHMTDFITKPQGGCSMAVFNTFLLN